jgi:thioredoxin 1
VLLVTPRSQAGAVNGGECEHLALANAAVGTSRPGRPSDRFELASRPTEEPYKEARMSIATLTDNTFEDHVASRDELVLVDFGADWCEPCKAMEPLLETIAEDYADRVHVVRLDVDESPDVAERLSVMSLPTLVFLQAGTEVYRTTGAHGKTGLVQQVEAALAKARS